MPVLIITPDMSAETWDGAAGCASGSQTWNGTSPALVPKPTTASTNSRPATAGDAWPSCISSNSSDPPARPMRRNSAIRNAVPRCVATR